jgi:1-acyl-sn-glycerol-3-phosphate acyltransferase
VQGVVHRPIVWMMAREYYELPVLGRVFRAIEAIPVSRDGKDSGALRAALRALDAGRILGVFPEGRIATTRGKLLPFETGAAMIAIRAGATVYPVHQRGTTFGQSMTAAVLRRQEVTLTFGPGIELASEFGRTKQLEAPTARLREAVQSLADA